MLDVHPDPVESIKIMISSGGRVSDVGRLVRSTDFLSTLRKTRAALDSVVSGGLFARVAQREFRFREYFDSDEDWPYILDERYIDRLEPDDSFKAKAGELMHRGKAEVVVEDVVRALVLRRI